MNTKVRDQLRRCQRRITRRLRKTLRQSMNHPVLDRGRARFEVANRTSATSVGGVRLVHDVAQSVGLPREIDDCVEVLKRHVPYHESDHVLSMTYNLLAGGTCIEDLELRRSDESFLDMLGADRIPDPTTAGDFCRRFKTTKSIDCLQTAINESRLRVWQRQPRDFFQHALVDADGTIAETTGDCKEGMDISFKKTWGYQVLIVSLANTEEVLFQDLRPASRPSHEGAANRLDESVVLLRRAGFRSITLRGDTDFSQTKHLDRWNRDGVKFVFGFQAAPILRKKAAALPDSAWSPLERKARYEIKTEPRSRPENVRQRVVMERELYNLHLVKEDIAEFDYRPGACKETYRMVVLRKLITHERGQKILFPETRYFFYITNKSDATADEVVEFANKRCNQERMIGELKSGVNALRMPLDTLHANWAYTIIATLAWNLSRWVGLMLPVSGRWATRHANEKRQVTKMRFRTFVNAMMIVPAQVVRTGRRLIVRLLNWNPWRHVFFRVIAAVRLTT